MVYKVKMIGSLFALVLTVYLGAAALAGDKQVLRKDLLLSGGVATGGRKEEPDEVPALDEVVKEAERKHILRALEAAGGKRTKAAEILGISRKTLWEKMNSLGISDNKD